VREKEWESKLMERQRKRVCERHSMCEEGDNIGAKIKTFA
jgi:hypothetical protein